MRIFEKIYEEEPVIEFFITFRPFSRTICVITSFQLYRRFFFSIETSGIDLGHVIVNEPNCSRIAQAQLKNKSLFIFFIGKITTYPLVILQKFKLSIYCLKFNPLPIGG